MGFERGLARESALAATCCWQQVQAHGLIFALVAPDFVHVPFASLIPQGRGEAAGLRIPVAARAKWKQPLYLMHGMVARTAPPAVRSRGRHAEELEEEGGECEWLPLGGCCHEGN